MDLMNILRMLVWLAITGALVVYGARLVNRASSRAGV
jgi:hypothetical protein